MQLVEGCCLLLEQQAFVCENQYKSCLKNKHNYSLHVPKPTSHAKNNLCFRQAVAEPLNFASPGQIGVGATAALLL